MGSIDLALVMDWSGVVIPSLMHSLLLRIVNLEDLKLETRCVVQGWTKRRLKPPLQPPLRERDTRAPVFGAMLRKRPYFLLGCATGLRVCQGRWSKKIYFCSKRNSNAQQRRKCQRRFRFNSTASRTRSHQSCGVLDC